MKKKITGALIVAAGKGMRSRSIIPKQYLHFGNKTVLQKNIENFIYEPLIDFVQIVINEKHIDFYQLSRQYRKFDGNRLFFVLRHRRFV